MDEISQSLVRNVRNGEYFKQSRVWFACKYLYPYTERSIMGLYSLVTLGCALIVLSNLMLLFPVHTRVPFIISSSDVYHYGATISHLNRHYESPYVGISRYLLLKYVDYRESYRFSDVQMQLTRMQNMSSKEVFKEFNDYLSLQNPNSPLLTYNRSVSREVTVLSLRFLETEEVNPHRAEIVFQTKDIRPGSQVITTAKWKATVGFNLVDIDRATAQDATVPFAVTEYSTVQLNAG